MKDATIDKIACPRCGRQMTMRRRASTVHLQCLPCNVAIDEFAEDMVLTLFDPAGEAHRRGTSRGMPYGDAGARSYRSLADALKTIPCLDFGDPRVPQDARRVSFEAMIEEVDFLLGQSAFQGFVLEIAVTQGLFAQTPSGLLIAKFSEHQYAVWNR